MNVALEDTEEWANGRLTAKYGDTFLRGNNGESSYVGSFSHARWTMLTPPQFSTSLPSRTCNDYVVNGRSQRVEKGRTDEGEGMGVIPRCRIVEASPRCRPAPQSNRVMYITTPMICAFECPCSNVAVHPKHRGAE